ncbi:MAG TPA: DUF523 domain-containing protein [Methylomirabilota bacterium]|nr:DUF523 domain-containing protein [Methylomirabilota bacterium]
MVRLGISACLLGEPVRYDGGHKRDATLLDTLGPHVTWVPELKALDLHGYVFKSGSPSCGLLAGGLFAAAFARAFPDLPMQEETRLADPRVRAAFLARARALASRRLGGDTP